MSKTPNQLAEEIIKLVNELAGMKQDSKVVTKKKDSSEHKGATGGLRLLIQEGFFDHPKELSAVIIKLKQEGRHYPKPTISMGLLSLVRERTLSRIQDKTKNWSYVIRK